MKQLSFTMQLYIMCPKEADGMVNSADYDQEQPHH